MTNKSKAKAKPKKKVEEKSAKPSIFIFIEEIVYAEGYVITTSVLNLPFGALIRSEIQLNKDASALSIALEFVPGIVYMKNEEVFLPIH